jgi:membrane fusion protein, multidrug efflux system
MKIIIKINKVLRPGENMKNLIVLIFLSLFVVAGCGGKEEKEAAKSIEQIRDEEGVPVKVQEINPQLFQKYFSFYSKLSGIKESTKSAVFGGKIESVRGRVGQSVGKGQVIIEMAEDNPGLQLLQAKSAYENSEKTYARVKKLLEAGETSQSNYDGAETQYLVAKRNYESQKQMLFIDAPFPGTIVDVKVNEGDNVKNETHLFTIAQLDRMKAKIWASEKEIVDIKRGMTAIVTCGGKEHIGKVTEVSLANDPFKQAFAVEVEFNNPKREMLCGVTSDIKILTYEKKDALVIPRNLVMTDENGKYIFVEKDGSAIKRYILNGLDSGLYYEISEGLQKGERIITQGLALLEDGKKVKIIQ